MSLLSLCAVPITKQKKHIYFSRPVTTHSSKLRYAETSHYSQPCIQISKMLRLLSTPFMVVLPTVVFFWYKSASLSRVVPFFAQLSGTNLPFRVSPKVHSSQPCNLVYFSTRRRFTVAGGPLLYKENELPVSSTCTMFQVSATLALRCCSAAASRSR